jgi:hypothetical protein
MAGCTDISPGPLSISQAMAVSLIFTFLTHQYDASDGEDSKTLFYTANYLAPLFFLVCGYVLKDYL